MSRFILQPTRVLLTSFVTSKAGEPLELTFKELCAKLVPDRSPRERAKLASLRRGMFIGRSIHRNADQNAKVVSSGIFLLENPGQSGEFGRVLRADPSFEHRILECYKILLAEYDGRIIEDGYQRAESGA